MTNLIVGAVEAGETGMATGINTVTRSVGGAIGGAVFASILSSHLASGGPSDHAFTLSFTVAAVGLGVASVAALAVAGRAQATPAEIEPAFKEA